MSKNSEESVLKGYCGPALRGHSPGIMLQVGESRTLRTRKGSRENKGLVYEE